MTPLTRTTQVSETVFLILIFCLQEYSQSSHLSPYCFPILLIRTMGVLPTLFRMLGMIFRGSGLVHILKKSVYSQKGQHRSHKNTTVFLMLFTSTSFLPPLYPLSYFGYFGLKPCPLDTNSQNIRSLLQNKDLSDIKPSAETRMKCSALYPGMN